MLTPALRWQTWMRRPAPSRAGGPPLRAELFSVAQLARHARALAAGHRVMPRHSANALLARLDENEKGLLAFYQATLAVDPRRRITPAAEWLLDNFHLIKEQIQLARRHLPRGYSRELPRLLNSPSAGRPRVYDIVLELISHADAQIDAAPLRGFIAAYQEVVSLTLGELWAVPIMLRLGLIENLQRITTRLALARVDRDLADHWVDRLQAMAAKNPSHLVTVVADMAHSDLPRTSSFVAEFCQRLSRQSSVLHLARGWLEQRLAEHGLSIEQLVHEESQNQAADQASVSHTIASLRFLGATDWKEFVEGLSLIEAILRTDPAGVYGAMDFITRDRYRHAVEFLARHSQLPEAEVARRAIRLAADRAREKGAADRTAHVGYFLVDQGREQLARLLAVRWPWPAMLERSIRRFPLAFYAGGIGLLSLLATLGFWHEARILGAQGPRLGALTLAFFVGGSQVAVALMNGLAMRLVKPRLLPRLDFAAGIPAECRTIVAVPTMLTSPDGVARLLEALEVHYLANPDPQLHFALLTDFRDAVSEVVPGDQGLLRLARVGVERLNRKYPAPEHPVFFLFHRPRRWNAGEKKWMGYERKRGKIAEFNALLRGGAPGCFSVYPMAPDQLPPIRYVVTLDTDTQLPRDAARRLVGTMAHPLNQPVFDAVRGVVTAGYGIMQPRIGVSLPSARGSWFARLFAGDAGIDPYTREVSDVYQDLFHEGSFIGKGIHDVDAFARTLHHRFPANTVLSHDLLEACHVRSALVCDVEFYEAFPARYDVDMDRRHRWIRGDWQIAPWLRWRVPGGEGRRLTNALSWLSQWKILDNLRRSLVPVALLGLLLGGWLFWPDLGGTGSLLVWAIVALPGLLPVLATICSRPVALPWAMHLRAVLHAGARQAARILLSAAFLPYEAGRGADAIFRTLGRMLVTRTRLLEWQTFADAEQGSRAGARWVLCPHVDGPGAGPGRERRAAGQGGTATAPGRAVPGALAGGARAGLVDQPAHGDGGAGLDPGPTEVFAPHGAQDLAFFRDIRHRPGELAAAGQFPGGARPGGGDANLAHQPGPGVARQPRRPGFRLPFRRRPAAADRGRAWHDASPRAAPWSFLQLV